MEYFMNSKNLFAVSFGMDEIKLYNFIMPSKKLELGMERHRLFFYPFLQSKQLNSHYIPSLFP